MSRHLEKSKSLLREVQHGRKTLNHNNNNNNNKREEKRRLEPTLWVPHPRTGIYYPKGHESVMESIPNGAASLKQKYWLRSYEGVDKPIVDPSTCGMFDHPFLNM